MKKVITFESKFNVGDTVTYNDRITHFEAKIVDIKFTESYKFMYKLEGRMGVWYTDQNLTQI